MRFAVLLIALVMLPCVSGINAQYDIIIEDNGNSMVLIQIQGEGIVNISLQEDVTDVRVKGGLYIQENQSIEIAIGSTQSAVVLYKTGMLTSKQGGEWHFSISPIQNSSVSLVLPKETIVLETSPPALIESFNYTKLFWDMPIGAVKAKYKFQQDAPAPSTPQKSNGDGLVYWGMGIAGAGVLALCVLAVLIQKKPIVSKKQHILKTLSQNENLVVKTLMESKGEIKRNLLEKRSGLAKSSLANTLNILERKGIIEIDKSFTAHFIKFTRWFDEL